MCPSLLAEQRLTEGVGIPVKQSQHSMAAQLYFLQWNCRGLRANIDELQILIQNFQPIVFALQETQISDPNSINLRQYSHFSIIPPTGDARPHGGASLLIRKNIPHSQIKLNTSLKAGPA